MSGPRQLTPAELAALEQIAKASAPSLTPVPLWQRDPFTVSEKTTPEPYVAPSMRAATTREQVSEGLRTLIEALATSLPGQAVGAGLGVLGDVNEALWPTPPDEWKLGATARKTPFTPAQMAERKLTAGLFLEHGKKGRAMERAAPAVAPLSREERATAFQRAVEQLAALMARANPERFDPAWVRGAAEGSSRQARDWYKRGVEGVQQAAGTDWQLAQDLNSAGAVQISPYDNATRSMRAYAAHRLGRPIDEVLQGQGLAAGPIQNVLAGQEPSEGLKLRHYLRANRGDFDQGVMDSIMTEGYGFHEFDPSVALIDKTGKIKPGGILPWTKTQWGSTPHSGVPQRAAGAPTNAEYYFMRDVNRMIADDLGEPAAMAQAGSWRQFEDLLRRQHLERYPEMSSRFRPVPAHKYEDYGTQWLNRLRAWGLEPPPPGEALTPEQLQQILREIDIDRMTSQAKEPTRIYTSSGVTMRGAK